MYFHRTFDCGCGGNGTWQPAQEETQGAARQAGDPVGPMAGGYFSTWSGDTQPAQVEPEPAPAE